MTQAPTIPFVSSPRTFELVSAKLLIEQHRGALQPFASFQADKRAEAGDMEGKDLIRSARKE